MLVIPRGFFLWLALVFTVLAIFAAHGSDLFNFGWPSWLCMVFAALIINWLFPRTSA